MPPPELIAFLGPSLPHAEAQRELRSMAPGAGARLSFSIEPPARQGDVWRALDRRPRVLALIDGVFESSPSVWHHELLDALDGGVLVFGAASMGALRASELSQRGMIGVGRIFARYRKQGAGTFDDDAWVALLHADAEHGFRPLTVPAANADHAIDEARRARALTATEATRMHRAADQLHYQHRRWPLIVEIARLAPGSRARWDAFVAHGLPDLKADDARLCLREAARAALAQRSAGPRPLMLPRSPPSSSRVRARRAWQQREGSPDELARESDTRSANHASLAKTDAAVVETGAAAAEEARRTLFIAGVARAAGLSAQPADLLAAEARLLGSRSEKWREQFLYRAKIAEDELRRVCETLALETLALRHIDRILPDGPSHIEAFRLAELLRRLARRS